MYSFCAMYSLRMSFCSVPEIFLQSAPCFSATARYIAQMTAAGELMVMEVVTLASGILSKSTSMSARELMRSEERRVGKECRCRGTPETEEKEYQVTRGVDGN